MTVITRFAPSPTGDLHIGGVRTALYCWLHAQKHHGKFLLRIEDTDRERSTQASIKVILDGLQWLNLRSEGEILYQSQRFDKYNAIIEQMLADGLAYYCWCSAEELQTMREQQKARGEKPKYNGKYRHGGEAVAGVVPVVRFKNPQSGSVSFVDKVRGQITVDNRELDDFIIRRSDGSPTYNFCVVVDDAQQNVSLVIRGDDHINNTPKQINLYKALQYKIPDFAHVPMILGDDGKRLSKRHGATNVLDYQKQGYLPAAVLNYLLRLGWSHGDQEIFSISEMIEFFDINTVHSAAATFNTEKLRWLNQQYIKETSVAQLYKLLRPHLQALAIDIDAQILNAAIPHYQQRAKTLLEMAQNMSWIAHPPSDYPEKARKKAFHGAETRTLLLALMAQLAALENFTAADIHQVLQNCVAAQQTTFAKLAMATRLAVTGGAPSPELDISLALAGKEQVLARLQNAAQWIAANMTDGD